MGKTTDLKCPKCNHPYKENKYIKRHDSKCKGGKPKEKLKTCPEKGCIYTTIKKSDMVRHIGRNHKNIS